MAFEGSDERRTCTVHCGRKTDLTRQVTSYQMLLPFGRIRNSPVYVHVRLTRPFQKLKTYPFVFPNGLQRFTPTPRAAEINSRHMYTIYV